MSKSELKYKLKGHESFAVREGWLNKGLTALQKDDTIFSSANAMDELGVGSKMVKSIKYWLLVTGLVAEHREMGKKHSLRLTPELGTVVWEHDRYFEDIFTLWIMHFHIVSSLESCTTWNLFFNQFQAKEFSKANMINKLVDEFNKIYDKGNECVKSIQDDCSCILKMYCASEDVEQLDPEDNLTSPFSELGLIKKSRAERSDYQRVCPVFAKLDRLVVLYILVSCMDPIKKSASMDTLLMQDNNIGKVLNLDRNMFNEYLDVLRQEGYITLNRTAGLDMVYLNRDITPVEILREYYTQIERDA